MLEIQIYTQGRCLRTNPHFCLYNQCTTKGLVGFLMNGAKLAGELTMICTLDRCDTQLAT